MNMSRIEDALDAILKEHAELVEEAHGFGMKQAARPAHMTLKEAQAILKAFEANTEKLYAFIHGLDRLPSVGTPFAEEMDAVRKKASAALKVFEADKKKAEAAVARYEDLLVGENFQKCFEAVRHAVLDLKLADDVDVDFDSQMNLTWHPAFSTGRILLKRDNLGVPMIVSIKYVADTDTYSANIHAYPVSKTQQLFENIVVKVGATRLPKFVRDVLEQVVRVDREYNLKILKPSKKDLAQPTTPARTTTPTAPALTTLSLSDRKDMEGPLLDSIKRVFPFIAFPEWLLQGDGSIYGSFQAAYLVFSVTYKGKSPVYFSNAVGSIAARARAGVKETTRFNWGGRDWIVTFPKANANIEYTLLDTKGVQTRVLLPNTTPLDLSTLKGANGKPLGELNNVKAITYVTFKAQPAPQSSASRIASRYLKLAGGSDFMDYVADIDAKRAFRKAVADAREEHGSRAYSGSIQEKDDFRVRSNNPMTKEQAYEFAEHDIEKNDKWGPAFAVPVAKGVVLHEEVLTLEVDAKDEATARKQGTLRIKATGRVMHDAQITVQLTKVDRISAGKFSVTGKRIQSKPPTIVGWLFYGIASS